MGSIDKETIKKIFQCKYFLDEIFLEINSKLRDLLFEIGFIDQFFNKDIKCYFKGDDYVCFYNEVDEDLVDIFVSIDVLSFSVCDGITSISIVGDKRIDLITLNNKESIYYLERELGFDRNIVDYMEKLRKE